MISPGVEASSADASGSEQVARDWGLTCQRIRNARTVLDMNSASAPSSRRRYSRQSHGIEQLIDIASKCYEDRIFSLFRNVRPQKWQSR